MMKNLHNLKYLLLRILAFLVSSYWFCRIMAIKFKLLSGFVLTSDIAYYGNMLYNTGWGQLLYTDFGVFRLGSTTFLTEHFAPTLVLLAPLYKLLPRPETLLVLQAGSIALSGFLLNLIGVELIKCNGQIDHAAVKESFGTSSGKAIHGQFTQFFFGIYRNFNCSLLISWVLPLILQILFLWNAATIDATVDDCYGFHQDSLIPLLLFLTVFFVLRSKFRIAFACFLLLIGTKENLPVLGVIICVYGMILTLGGRGASRQRCLIWIYACLIMFAGSYYFQHLTGNRHVAILSKFFIANAWIDAARHIREWQGLAVFLPTIFCFPALVIGLPELSLQLMGTTQPTTWHIFTLLPIISIGAFCGCIFMLCLARNWFLKTLILALYIVLLVWPALRSGNDCMARLEVLAAHSEPKVNMRDLRAISLMIPNDAVLTTSSDLLVFFTDRAHLRWPEQNAGSDFVLVSEEPSEYSYDKNLLATIKKLELNKNLEMASKIGVLTLYRSIPCNY
jgi:uncharacterized membrane protein